MATAISWTMRSAALVHVTWFLSLLVWAWLPVGLGQARSAVIVSGSMTPGITPGDVVVYDRVGGDEVEVGQVVLIDDPASPGTLLTHRVIARRPTGEFVTKGDANAEADSTPVPPANILGRARLLVPVIGRITLLRQGDGLVWTGMLAVSLLIVTRDVMSGLAGLRATRRIPADTAPADTAPADTTADADTADARSRAGRHRWQPRHAALAGAA